MPRTIKPIDDLPEYREAKAKLDALKSEKAALEERINRARSSQGVREEARRHLAGEEPNNIDLQQAAQRVKVLGAAIGLQEEAVGTLRRRLSIKACEDALPVIKQIGMNRLRAARAIAELLHSEQLERDAIEAAGYALVGLPQVPASITIDSITDFDGDTARLLKQAASSGLFDKGDPVFDVKVPTVKLREAPAPPRPRRTQSAWPALQSGQVG
jgi:hypothetical protein